MTPVCRFAPSPTGFLHVGGARTALYNWLFARHHRGIFRLRIEDTDIQRSTPEAIQAILDGLTWLGLNWDEDVVYQSRNAARHAEVARRLVEIGKAYYCYCSPEELAEMRETARREGRPVRYDGRWRDRDPADAPPGVPPVIRIKVPQSGTTTIEDLVQGEVTVANEQLDDFVLLRADGTPTYMLSVVVDDHDMDVTHVIRGDDHLNNAFRQLQLARAMDWSEPVFAHIPLIHGPDGKKLSKRHGALGVEAYRELGYLPEAMRNYLLRLGWGHGDEEIIGAEQAIEWFNIRDVGRAAARFDFAKLENLNGHYLRSAEDHRLVELVFPFLEAELGSGVDEVGRRRLLAGMDGLKQRAKTLKELAQSAVFYCRRPTYPLANSKAAKLLADEGKRYLRDCIPLLCETESWTAAALENLFRDIADRTGLGLGKLAQPLRAALTGSSVSPGIFEVMEVLGREETLARLSAVPGLADTR